MTVPGYVVRRSDGKYFQGCGYGGPKKPVPYFTEELALAKVYKTQAGAVKVAQQFGGYAGAVYTDVEDGTAVMWRGFIVYQPDGWWQVLDIPPKDFDPEDYTGNNGPLIHETGSGDE